MPGFADAIRAFNVKAKERALAVHVVAPEMVLASIVHGSPLTGAPALPVAQGNVPNAGELRDGVTLTRPDATTAVISTDVSYAPDVEDNLRGVKFHNGGPHGWKLTAAGWTRIVDAAVRQVAGSGA